MVQGGVGWAGAVQTFLETNPEDLQAQLGVRNQASATQATAWEATIEHLRRTFRKLVEARPEAAQWWVLFEYELPREGGRRPDVVVLTSSGVFVIEVKNQGGWDLPHVDQVRAYVRDLQHYHAESRDRVVEGILLILGAEKLQDHLQETSIIGPEVLLERLMGLQGTGISEVDGEQWLSSAYEPLPQLVRAAKYLFDHEPLPQIRSAKSANIPQTLKVIRHVIHRARSTKKNQLVLLTGPPGSGKTLVGLQAVYDLADEGEAKRGIYLSGNGPLIQVLQHVLKSKEFVQDVHRFIREYGIRKRSKVSEDFLVFDEAQRAWNAAKIEDFYTRKKVEVPSGASEPDLFIQAADESGGGVTVLALVGTGQEIHSGEQNGLSLWVSALQKSEANWELHGPPELKEVSGDLAYQTHPELSLGLSLRSHVAEELHEWAEAVVTGDVEAANRLAADLQKSQFFIYVTQDIDQARAYVRSRYHDEPTKTYGMLASSKARNLKDIGVDITMFGNGQVRLNRDEAAWYAGKNGSEPECRKLEKAATEFTCQGLELDATIVLWGYDYVWTGSKWESRKGPPNPLISDPHALRVNAYRVLLTRARDGIVLVVPNQRHMKQTLIAFTQAGAVELTTFMRDQADAADLELSNTGLKGH